MKTRLFFILLLMSVVFCSCNKTPQNEEQVYYGIDNQVLSIVDSMNINTETSLPFITIWFSSCNNEDNVIRFFDSILIPAPPLKNAIKATLISEGSDFYGYKKYHNIYLVFLSIPNGKIEKFVNKDSLNFDDEPFAQYNVYEIDDKYRDRITIEKKYLINESDSLIFYDGKCLFEIDR